MKKYIIIPVLLIACDNLLVAQEKESSPLTISGYAEVYYLQDFNRPLDNKRPSFIYSHNRTNEVSVNLAILKANYATEHVRANLSLGAGSYMTANYSAEPDVLKNVYEVNVGIKISKKHEVWIDAGIMPSHIGFESAVGLDNWTVTRSLIAENSPYFETGAKISYTTPSGEWFLSVLFLNGWQRIQRIEGNTTPAFGHQLTYKPNSKITLNSSSFIGSDQPDSTMTMRYFHNLYGQFQVNEKWSLLVAFDVGAEQDAFKSDRYSYWFTPILIAKYTWNEKTSMAVRGEYYQDEKGVIIDTKTPNGFKTFGYSMNVDYAILPNVVWRMELRNLSSKYAIFMKRNDRPSQYNIMAITALAVRF